MTIDLGPEAHMTPTPPCAFIRLTDGVARGHTFALVPIGSATADITPGTHVHRHNLATALAERYEKRDIAI